METQESIETTIATNATRSGQLRLFFTGEPEAGMLNESVSGVQSWLFDPDLEPCARRQCRWGGRSWSMKASPYILSRNGIRDPQRTTD
jgi:hypothetical protein